MDRLKSYLPEYYQGIKEIEALMEAEGYEVTDLLEKIESVFNQKFVDDATWGLDLWEKELGLPVNPQLTENERRSKIKGRIRGTGKVGAELIKEVIDAYTNGDIEVFFDEAIKVQFTSCLGIPTNLDDAQKAVEEIIPAHLELVYLFKYFLLKDIHDNDEMKLAKLEIQTLDKFASNL